MSGIDVGKGPAPDDAIYYRHAGSLPFVSRVSRRARERLYTLFLELMRPGPETTVLDLGASTDVSSLEANVLESLYPHRGKITCAGLGEPGRLLAAYPGVRFARVALHEPLPFPDASFDLVYSNAVLEHAGSRAQQARLVREAQRVGRRVFIAVPNRWFPIEQHTGLPLLHYLPPPVFRAILKRTPLRHWALEENLNHLTASELPALFADPARVRVTRAGIGWGPFASNLVAWT